MEPTSPTEADRLQEAVKSLGKRFGRRIWVWLLGFMVLVLADEYVKEGYLFNPLDITHEALVLCLIGFAGGWLLHSHLHS